MNIQKILTIQGVRYLNLFLVKVKSCHGYSNTQQEFTLLYLADLECPHTTKINIFSVQTIKNYLIIFFFFKFLIPLLEFIEVINGRAPGQGFAFKNLNLK